MKLRMTSACVCTKFGSSRGSGPSCLIRQFLVFGAILSVLPTNYSLHEKSQTIVNDPQHTPEVPRCCGGVRKNRDLPAQGGAIQHSQRGPQLSVNCFHQSPCAPDVLTSWRFPGVDDALGTACRERFACLTKGSAPSGQRGGSMRPSAVCP